MENLTDRQLLCEYAGNHSEAAFAELVRRYVDLVYSSALRLTGDAHGAKDALRGLIWGQLLTINKCNMVGASSGLHWAWA